MATTSSTASTTASTTRDRAPLPLYVVTHNPTDYPGKYVLRVHEITRDAYSQRAQPEAVVDTLEAVRTAVPRGLVRLAPAPGDDPAIVEVWL